MTGVSFPLAAKSSAPGQYLGYSLQQVRLCYYLLSVADNDWVSLEFLDDVAVHREDGSILLEQSKSALSGNPASNKSEELWKTFANWADICKESGLDIKKTDFHYYISPSKTGKILREIVQVTEFSAAKSILEKIRSMAIDADPKLPWVGHINRFLQVDSNICAEIIVRCKFFSETDPIECIRNRLNLLPMEDVVEYTAAIIGLARDRIDELIRGRQKPIIQAADFRRRVWAFISRHTFSNVLQPSKTPPKEEEIQALVVSAPLFVRQLSAIDAKPPLLTAAVSDYLRTAADKVFWAERGIVLRRVVS